MGIRIGTRGSPLSLMQTYEVINLLKGKIKDFDYEVITITSRGDIDRKTPLYKMGEKGIFEREVNKALLNGKVDIAVHSAKDVPTELVDEIYLAAIPPRHSARDVLISRSNCGIDRLSPDSKIGTSSLRRMSFLKYFRPDVDVVPIRGNIDTRIRKFQRGEVDGIIIAEAGVLRLNLNINYIPLNPESFVPSAGQGALMIFCLSSDKKIISLLKHVDDAKSRISVIIEKEIVRKLNVGCKTPVGVYAHFLDDDIINIIVGIVTPDYERLILAKCKYKINSPHNINRVVDDAILKFYSEGGEEVLSEWRRRGI